jgi:hypothetical protein
MIGTIAVVWLIGIPFCMGIGAKIYTDDEYFGPIIFCSIMWMIVAPFISIFNIGHWLANFYVKRKERLLLREINAELEGEL